MGIRTRFEIDSGYRAGFTLIELMLVVAIIGILAAIGIPQYANLVNNSKEGATKGSLSDLRSSLSIYYGDNEQVWPSDDLTSLITASKYLPFIPPCKTPPHHADTTGVTAESLPTDSGSWSYDNDSSSAAWGTLVVGCLHEDHGGRAWTTY